MYNDRLLKHTPQLRFDSYVGMWCMTLQGQDVPRSDDYEDTSFGVYIKVAWNGESWYQYRFVRWDMGEVFELLTLDEYEDRLKAIRDHEGDEVADIWNSEQDRYEVVRDDHPVFKLAEYWKAMMTLGFFDAHVTLAEWKPKPFSEELRNKLDEASKRFQEKWMREASEDFEAEARAEHSRWLGEGMSLLSEHARATAGPGPYDEEVDKWKPASS